jgi:hypothetical protein
MRLVVNLVKVLKRYKPEQLFTRCYSTRRIEIILH